MASAPVPSSVDEYIAGFPPETRRLLEELRAIIKRTEPSATERISYRMPTFDYRGRVLIYFAGFKDHVSVYPIIGAVEAALGEDIQRYKSGKGTVRFSLTEPLPVDIIERIVRVKAKEIESRK